MKRWRRRILIAGLALLACAWLRAGEEGAAKPEAEREAQIRIVDKLIADLEEMRDDPGRTAEDLLKLRKSIKQLEQHRRMLSRGQKESALLDELHVLLRAKAEAQPDAILPQEMLARFYLSVDRPQAALERLDRVGTLLEESGRLERNLNWPLLMAYTYLQLGDYDRCDAFVKHADEILAERAPLRLHGADLAKRVVRYRLYEPWGEDPIEAGDSVLLYVEMDGVVFRQGADGLFGCNLMFGLELRDELQNRIWQKAEYGAYTPTYRGRIRDMHASIMFRVPRDLKPGRYRLVITCEDRNSPRPHARSMTDLGFNIGARQRPVAREEPEDPALPPTGGTGKDLLEQNEKINKALQRQYEMERRQVDSMAE